MNTIEMSFRPDTYWPESLTPEQRLSRINGKRRQDIARISMQSTTADQVSVRARVVGDAIRYRIVGEYEEDEDMRYQLPFETSPRPLSLTELMKLIDGSELPGDSAYPGGILTSSWNMMREFAHDAEELIGFLSLSSAFYPQISQCYQELAWRWLEEHTEAEELE